MTHEEFETLFIHRSHVDGLAEMCSGQGMPLLHYDIMMYLEGVLEDRGMLGDSMLYTVDVPDEDRFIGLFSNELLVTAAIKREFGGDADISVNEQDDVVYFIYADNGMVKRRYRVREANLDEQWQR